MGWFIEVLPDEENVVTGTFGILQRCAIVEREKGKIDDGISQRTAVALDPNPGVKAAWKLRHIRAPIIPLQGLLQPAEFLIEVENPLVLRVQIRRRIGPFCSQVLNIEIQRSRAQGERRHGPVVRQMAIKPSWPDVSGGKL